VEIEIQDKKLELIQWLTTLENSVIIQKLLDLKKNESKDWWITLSEAEKSSIEKGLSDAENGKLKPHSEAIKVYGKWL
jgi:predicted transcriptional regulator